MSRLPVIALSVAFLVLLVSGVRAQHAKVDTTLGNLRIELHALPPEPFFTKDQVSAGKATNGMLIMGGAKPVAPEAEIHPNRHLVIHVFDAKTDKVITDAKVKMSFQSLDEKGIQLGTPVDVPIVVMQAIGKGAESTHYGNNVVLPDGPLTISLVVNGKKLKLRLDIPYESGNQMEDMNKHP